MIRALRAIRGTAARFPYWRLAFTAVLLIAVFWFVDWHAAVRALRDADAMPILAALLLVQVQIVASAWRWRFTAGRLGQRIGRAEAVREYYAASFANQVLPGGIAGDVLRAVRTSAGSGRSSGVPMQAIVLERLAGQIALFAVAALGLVVWAMRSEEMPPLAIAAAPFAVIAGAGVLAALAARFAPRAVRDAIASLGTAITAAYVARRAWLWQGLMSVLVVATYIGVFALSGLALDAPLPLAGLLVAVPLALLAMLVPVSVGGWGLREGAAAVLWTWIGLTAAEGVATSMLYGLVSLLGAAPGLAILMMRRRSAQTAPPVAKRA
jgi:glycosyltransferase 2 family protein